MIAAARTALVSIPKRVSFELQPSGIAALGSNLNVSIPKRVSFELQHELEKIKSEYSQFQSLKGFRLNCNLDRGQIVPYDDKFQSLKGFRLNCNKPNSLREYLNLGFNP